jgi:uncharacterized protein YdhG (YjbR/CyaY superfamily)
MPARKREPEPATAEIDAILAALPADQRTALQALRRTIQVAAPEAIEAISYGAPAFRYRGRPLVSYGAGKQHYALYVMAPDVIETHRDRLSGFDLSKGTIRFRPDAPLPDGLIESVVHARMAQTDGSAR